MGREGGGRQDDSSGEKGAKHISSDRPKSMPLATNDNLRNPGEIASYSYSYYYCHQLITIIIIIIKRRSGLNPSHGLRD